MISRKLAVAGSTGSFRTGAVNRNETVCPVGVRAGILMEESGGSKKGVTAAGGIKGGKVKGGIRRGG
jgi:hypothetical protein